MNFLTVKDIINTIKKSNIASALIESNNQYTLKYDKEYSDSICSQSCIYNNSSVHIGHLIVDKFLLAVFQSSSYKNPYKNIHFQNILKVMIFLCKIHGLTLIIRPSRKLLSFDAGFIRMELYDNERIVGIINNTQMCCSSYKSMYDKFMFPILQKTLKRTFGIHFDDIDSISNDYIMLIEAYTL